MSNSIRVRQGVKMSLKSRSDTPVISHLWLHFITHRTNNVSIATIPSLMVERFRPHQNRGSKNISNKANSMCSNSFSFPIRLLHCLFLLRGQQLSLSLNLRRICVSRARFISKEIQPQNKRAAFSIFKLKKFQGPIWLVNSLSYYKCHIILPFP